MQLRLAKVVRLGVCVVAAGLIIGSTAAVPQPQPGPTEIRIGNVLPYTGPAAAYATMGRTIAAYYRMINDQGGVNGRPINFISYDDGYNPARALDGVRRLVERDDVLLVGHAVGTEVNLALRDYLNRAGIPQLFIITGASVFENPENYPWTMRFNFGLRAEAAAFAQHIRETFTQAKIGVLYQDDDFGRDLLDGLTEAIAGQFEIVAQPYAVSDATVDAQIAALQAADADILMIFATPRFAAQAIRRAAEIQWHPYRMITSVGSSVGGTYIPAGLDISIGIVTTGTLKNPSDPRWADDPEIVAFKAFMAAYYPEGDPNGTFEAFAYTVAGMMVEVLGRAGDDLTRENIMRIATTLVDVTLPLLLPGVLLNTGAADYAPIEAYWMMQFDGVGMRPIGPVLQVPN